MTRAYGPRSATCRISASRTVPAFGSGQAGAQGVPLPFLALSGTSDPIAPHDVVRAALTAWPGRAGTCCSNGQGHDLDPGSGGGHLHVDADVPVGVGRRRLRPRGPRLPAVDTSKAASTTTRCSTSIRRAARCDSVVVDMIEFHNATLDHYFITAFPEEAAALDAGVPPGWTRTGKSFKAWKSGTGPRQRGVPLLRHARPGAELALLYDRRGRVRQGQGESRLDVRGARVPRGRAAVDRLRRRVRDGHPALQQRHGRTGESPLPDRSRGHRGDRRARVVGRGPGVLRAALTRDGAPLLAPVQRSNASRGIFYRRASNGYWTERTA